MNGFYEKEPQRQRTRMTRIERIFADTKSVYIRVIREIRVLSLPPLCICVYLRSSAVLIQKLSKMNINHINGRDTL